jgi:hypothetical protein
LLKTPNQVNYAKFPLRRTAVGLVIARWPGLIAFSEVVMTKKISDFKVPAVKRAIKVAHSQQLVVDSFDIRADGTIHIEIRDYEVTPDGAVRVHEAA